MSETKKNKPPPLLINQEPRKPQGITPLPYQFGKDTYEVYLNTKNPFIARILVPEPEPLTLAPEKARALFKQFQDSPQYQLVYPTRSSPYQRRKVKPSSVPLSSENKSHPPVFSIPRKLAEDGTRTQEYIQHFFESLLKRLKDDPYSLPWIVNELVPLFMEHQIRIKIYTAFQQFHDWNQFMQTLEQITENHDLENFEMFCSALFGFYSQLQ
ncbi:MAG: hypothetical protein HQM11_08515 [SAR324 cluster bacterium]|nr:hypothetical protein [SAR324 cluster bacterium]